MEVIQLTGETSSKVERLTVHRWFWAWQGQVGLGSSARIKGRSFLSSAESSTISGMIMAVAAMTAVLRWLTGNSVTRAITESY